MSAPQSLVQAALNRLSARVGSGLMDAAANLAVLAQDAPLAIQRELQVFWEEVEQEAQRLERGDGATPAATPAPGEPGPDEPPTGDPQQQIDQLRARVADLTRRLDGQPREPA
ncbi:MAG: hypothetical protein VKN13_07490 [Cyanobacteriota bacterium]|nr:hypothetical protein [Cyanobacteriota bacterium]